MPVVHHHVEHPDGTPAVLLDVHIDLITGDQRPSAFRRSDRTGIATRVDLDTDGAGWTADLVETSDVQPGGSVYRVTEHIDGAPRAVWHFKVPDGPGPYELADLLADAPDGPQAVIVANSGLSITGIHADPSGAVVLTLADGRSFALVAADITDTGFGFDAFGTAPFGGEPVPPSDLLPLLGLAPLGLAPLGGTPA